VVACTLWRVAPVASGWRIPPQLNNLGSGWVIFENGSFWPDTGGQPAQILIVGPMVLPGGRQDLAIEVGLSFYSDCQPLDVVLAGAEVKTKLKRVTSVAFEVQNATAGSLKVGETNADGNLITASLEAGNDGTQRALQVVTMRPSSTWNRGGRAYLRHEYPGPCTILGITRDVDIGGTG
jgi:hypothetical protein